MKFNKKLKDKKLKTKIYMKFTPKYSLSFRGILFVAGVSVLSLLMPSCASTKKVATVTEPTKAVQPPANKLKAEDFLTKTIDWNTFSGKADMHFEKGDQNQDASCNLRMNKGKDIWASIIALGILEAARAKITPDSLQAIVKITKDAYALSYKDGQALIGTQVDFSVLQNLLIGNPLITGVPVKNFEVKDSTVVITQVKDDFTQVLTYNTVKGTLQSLQLSSDSKGFSCNIRYEKYGPITLQQPFAFNRYIIIKNKGEDIKLNFEFSKAELNTPVETPFSIPSSYTMKSIPKK